MKKIHKPSFFKTATYYDADKNIYITQQPAGDLSSFYKQDYFDDFYTREKSVSIYKRALLYLVGNPPQTPAVSDYKLFSKYIRQWNSFFEIGSGDGDMLDIVRHKFTHVAGLEMDDYQFTLLSRRYPTITLYRENYEDTNIENTYDVVYMRHVLEHVRDYQETLKKILRNLNHNGVVYINVPNADNPDILTTSIEDHPHTFHFTKVGLRNILESQGFTVEHIGTYNWITTNRWKILWKRLWRQGNLISSLPLESEYLIAIARKV